MLIGLVGRARSGKSTVVSSMVERAQEKSLKPWVYDIGGFVRSYCVSQNLLPNIPRESMTDTQLGILVRVGKEQRDADPDIWIYELERYYRKYPESVVLIPNVRYNNELSLVRRNGGHVVRVTALNPNGSVYISRDRDPNHVSETELLDARADYSIVARKGESFLLREYARTLFDYLYGLEVKAVAPDTQVRMVWQ
jgi:hypothetical protein